MSSSEFLALAFENSPRRQEGGVSRNDILKRAIELGMDPYKDENLMWIPEQSLRAKLTDGWVEYLDDDGNVYYYNENSEQSSWDHPALTSYKQLYVRMKTQVQVSPRSTSSTAPNSAKSATLTDYLCDKQNWSERLPAAIPQYHSQQKPAHTSELLSEELNLWKRKCEDLEGHSKLLEEENRMMKVGLIDCEDKLRSVTSEVRQYLLKADFPCAVIGGMDGGVVAAITDSEAASRACLNAFGTLVRAKADMQRRVSDVEEQAVEWKRKEAELKDDFNSMERKLLATIEKKKSTIYMIEDDLSALQVDVDRLRTERNDLRDLLEEQRAGDTSFDIIAKKLDGAYAKNKELMREIEATRSELEDSEIKVRELREEIGVLSKRLQGVLEELEAERTHSTQLSGERAAVGTELLAAQKELRRMESSQQQTVESASAEEALQQARQRLSDLEDALEGKNHELEVVQERMLGLQERLNDQKNTEKLLSAKLEGNSDRYMCLQDRVAELLDKISKKESEAHSLHQHNEQLKSQLTDALHAANRTKADQAQCRDEVDSLLSEKRALEEMVERLEDDSRGSSHRYQSLKSLFDKSVADLEDSQTRISTLKTELEASRSLKEELRDEKRRCSTLESEVEKKCHDLAVAQTKILGLQERLEDQKSTEQLLSSKFTSLTRSLEELRSSQEVSKESEQSAKASAEMKVYELEVQRLSDQLSNERRRLADTERSLATSERRAEELASRELAKQMEHSSKEQTLQAKVERKEAIIQEQAEQRRELEKNVAELYKDLNAALTENETLRKLKAEAESAHAQVDSSQLAMANAKLDMERERCLALEEQMSQLRAGSTSNVAELEKLHEMNDELMRKAREATRSVSSVQEELDRERDICLALTNDHCDLENEVKRLRQRIVKLNDTIVELKGSIMVFCRVRPVGQREVEELDITQAEIDRLVHYPDYNLIDFKQNTFEYDRVFSPASTQEVIYDEVEPFVRSAMGGYRVCIFAYGQTSSGKTHTMEGPEHDRGVNLRALSTILHLSEVDDKYATTVTMSMLEVYNEKIRDLLTLDEETVDLDVRMGKTGTYVDGLGEYPIRTLDDALETIGRGAANRMVASNHVNEHSSRSHLVSLIKIDRRHNLSGDTICGYLYMVDLAGSERIKQTAATGQRLKEAQNINKSLSSLGDVIAALASGQKHIPYRNSKLTFLLQDALRENSKVLMFVNLNPTPGYAGESLCSLQFASRCRSAETTV